MYKRNLFIIVLCWSLLGSALLAASSFERGKIIAAKGDWRRAIPFFLRALKEQGTSTRQRAAVYFFLAKAYRHEGDQKRALACVQRARRLAPVNKRVQALFKTLQQTTREFPDEFKDARVAFWAGLENERLYDGTGRSLLEEAARVFVEALEREHEVAFSNFALGTCLLEIGGKRAEALEYLRASHRLAPDNPELLYRLGVCALQDGDATTAVTHFEACQKHGGVGPDGAAALVKAYGLRGGTVDKKKVEALFTAVVGHNADLAGGLPNHFSDASFRRRLEGILQHVQRKNAAEAASRARQRAHERSRARRPVRPTPRPRAPAKPKKPQKTQVEKNYDTYNALRYRQYLDHLNRLARGQASSWSGAIPKKPQKK